MTKRKSILGDTVTNTAAMLISLVGGLGTQSILAWNLGPAGRGEYGVWIATATVVGILFSLGADRAIQVFLIGGKISVSQAVTSVLLVGMSGVVLSSALLGFASHAEWSLIDTLLPKSIGVAVLVVPAVVLPTALQLLLTGLRHFRAVAALSLLRAVCQLSLAAVFLIKLDWGIEGAFAGYAIGAAVFTIGSLAFIGRRHGRIIEWLPREVCKQMSFYAIRYLPARLGHVVNCNLVLFLLAIIATKNEVGYFSLAVVLMGQFLIVSDALNQSIMPRLGLDSQWQAELVAKCCRYSLPMHGILLISGTSVLSFLLPTLFSPEFQKSIVLLWILLPGIWLRGAAKPLLAYFISTHKPTLVSIATSVEIVISMLAIALLYPPYGVLGAAAATSFGNGLNAIVLSVAFGKQSQQGLVSHWLLTREDISSFKDHLVVMLGIPLKRRTFFSETAAAKCDSTQIERKTVITATEVTKVQPHAQFSLELDRTEAIAELARQSNVFSVPRILKVDESKSSIVFERLRHARPLRELLYKKIQADELLIRSGKAIAEIHNLLSIPTGERSLLPQKWLPISGLPSVNLHGDFTVSNVLYCTRVDRLYVIDCATSDLCGGQASTGPWCFDVAWFVGSLLHSRGTGSRPFTALSEKARLFVDAYCQESIIERDTKEFQDYFAAFSAIYSEANASFGRTFFRRLRSQPPSQSVIQGFARTLMSDLESQKKVA